MIKEMKSLTIAEAEKIAKDNEGSEAIKPYFKKFIKVKLKNALEMKKELEALNNHKIKPEHIVKVIDFLPEDASEVNKIFIDVSLDEEEIKQITDVVKKYK